jgi:CheY-like chemotaxis protein
MLQELLIIGLVFIIVVMAWVWYIQAKRKTTTLDKTIESLKEAFDAEYYSLIDSINESKHSYDACKILLTHIQQLNEKKTLLEAEVKESKTVHAKVSDGLDKKSHEIIHISHQMRTSLSGLLGFTHFLEATKMTEEQQEFVSIISTSSDELLTLVNNIIDMTPKPHLATEIDKSEIATPKNEIPYVLVVDDNEINKRLLAKVLENENLKVSYASNGEEAVSLREEHDFDIIFMDIQMPVMDGVEASKAIRQYEDEQDIAAVPIIALTANTGKNDRDTYLDAGMTDYMAKPIMIDEVRKRIAQL